MANEEFITQQQMQKAPELSADEFMFSNPNVSDKPTTPEETYNYSQDDPYSPYYNSVASVQDKNIAKKFSRTDRLGYGFTFKYEQGTERQHITLFINPEEFVQVEPPRITITQTKGGAFVDHYGRGLKQITMRGVTGYRKRDVGGGRNISGHDHFLQLRKMIRDWEENSQLNPSENHLYFFNWGDQEYYEIVISQFQLLRNVSRPLLYQYNISFTVIKDLIEWSQPPEEPIADYLLSPEKRAPLAKDSLTKQVGFVSDVVNKNIDISGMTTGTQEWSTLIAKGTEYYNTIEGVYKTVESVVSDVEDFARDVEMFTTGLTNFITKPFELVQDLAISVGAVVEEMVAVKNVPHELVRAFRSMVCAIQALPESLYKGFTNPALFEGESNCGSTLGIPEAPVSIYDNSFEATAQIPPERSVAQVFRTPQATVMLKESPLQVKGVYLETDVARTGNNYFQAIAGNIVTLTSVPDEPIVVDYTKREETAQNIRKLSTATAKILLAEVTLERLSYEVYGDPSRWKDIALYNDLEYPFIVEPSFEKEYKATGTVRFYRKSGFYSAMIIPKGTLVWTPDYHGTRRIYFQTTVAKTLELAAVYVDVSVEAMQPGEIGNVGPGLITQFDPQSLPSWPTLSIKSIGNVVSTSGGKIWRVVRPGDILMIPKEEREVVSVVVNAQKSYEELFGVDILLDKNGEFASGTEAERDLSRAFGVANLVQALRNRINTERRFYAYHSEYGTDLPYYIGHKNNPYWADLVKVDIRSACINDPRIDSIERFLMMIEGDVIGIKFNAIPINEHTSLPIDLIV